MDNNTKRKSTGSGCDNEHNPVLKRRKVFGPVLPSSYMPQDPRNEQGVETTGTEGLSREDEDEDADDSDGDDYGPCLPPLGGEVIANLNNEVMIDNEPHIQSGKPDAHSNNSQRDTWMLRPPKPSDLSSRIDPTRLKNRKFQGGQSLGHSGEEVDITWTETPLQKLKRLQDEAMGLSPQSVLNHDRSSTPRTSKSTQQHDSTKASERSPPSATNLSRSSFNDDPSCRPFQWDKDMASAPRISTLQHQKQVGDAVGFASKFTKGKYL